MSLTTLNALSPLDGRYQTKLDALRPYFSEYALIKHRAWVEVEWLKALAAAKELAEISPFSAGTINELNQAIAHFSEADASQVKAIEARTNHDVKALEYWLKALHSLVILRFRIHNYAWIFWILGVVFPLHCDFIIT